MRRIYFGIFGSGLGHVTRVLDIGARLRKDGDEFCFSSSLQALNYLKTHNNGVGKVVESPPLDVEWAQDGSFSSKDFIPHFPSMFNSFLKQIAFETRSIPDFAPNVVVSDSRLSPVIASARKSFPVVTILNQFKVTMPPRFRVNSIGRFYERFAGDVLGLLWSLSDEVLMTDLPPPYTIGEANLEGGELSNVVRYVGFTSPRYQLSVERLEKARRMLNLDARPLVFMQISGPDATKKRFSETALLAAQTLSKSYNVVISLGYPNGSGEPKRMADGTILYEWCPVKDELFELSSVVVARSGHGTIGQCIDNGKPAVLIPIRNHSEQLGNAEKFASLGLGIALKSGDADPQALIEAVQRCVNDSRYKQKVEAVREISKRYDGVERCAKVISSYA